MRTIAIIPARSKSNRLPGKNYQALGGIPLIAHSIIFAKANSKIIDEIYVTTDCAKIKEIAVYYGVKVINRPDHLAGDFEPTVSALKHVLHRIGPVDNIVLLQPTNPLRHNNLLIDAFAEFQESPNDSLFSVSRNHQKLGRIVDNKYIPFNYALGQRSQDMDPLFFENGLLYISKSDLIKDNIIISDSAIPFEVDHPFCNVDIDTQDDFDYAEYLYNKNT